MKTNFYVAGIALTLLTTLTACGGGGGGSSDTTQVTLTILGDAPLAISVQTPGSNWAMLTPNGSSASFSVPTGGAYSVAVVCAVFSSTQIETIFQATTFDTVSPTSACPKVQQVGPMTVNFNASAIAAAQEVAVTLGTVPSAYWPGPVGAANVPSVIPGVQDVAIAAYGPSPNTPPYGVEIERGVNVTGAPLTVPLMALGDAAGSATVSLTGVPAGYTPSTTATYITAGGADIGINGNNVSSYALIAGQDTAPGDYYDIEGSATNAGSTSFVLGKQSFTMPQNLSIALPAPLVYSGPTPDPYPVFNISYNGFTVGGNHTLIAVLNYPIGPIQEYILDYATPAYLGSDQLTIPNLSSLPDFIPPAASGAHVTWDAGASVESDLYEVFSVNTPPNNETVQAVLTTGTFTEP